MDKIYYDKAKDALKNISGLDNWNINPLMGGLSGSKIFLGDNGKEKYVLRFFGKVSEAAIKRLIYNQEVASNSRYGPKLKYYNQELIIMEYIKTSPINKKTFYTDIAKLINKIHTGPKFKDYGHIWDAIYSNIEIIKGISQNLLDLDDLKKHLDSWVDKIKENLDIVPSHRDLNPRNFIYSDQQFWAIDYEAAGNDDRYIDIADVAVYNCLNETDKIKLLTAYLGREPLDSEFEKYKTAQEIAYTYYGTAFLCDVPLEYWVLDEKLCSLKDYLNLVYLNKVDLDEFKEKLKIGLILIKEAYF